MQQKPLNSNVNNQFVTITDEHRKEIIRKVNSDFTLKAPKWKKDSQDKWVVDTIAIFGACQTPANHIDVQNMTSFRDYFISNIVKEHLTQKVDSQTLADMFNSPETFQSLEKYNKLDVQYIILSEMNKILMQTAAFYRLNLNIVKEKGWDFESFEAVKEFKKANPIQATPQRKGPMDRYAVSGASLSSSSSSKKQTPPSRQLGAIDKFITRTPKVALATSVDSSNSLSSKSSSPIVESPLDNKQTAAAAVPVTLVNNDSSVASTSLKDSRNQPAAAAALLVVNPGQHSNSVNVAYLSSASRTVTTQRLSTPKKNTTVRFNIGANGNITPLSPRASRNTPPKRTSHAAGFREEDDDAIVGSLYKAPKTKENHGDRSPSF